MPATRKLLFVRHGATRLNNDDVSVDRIRGWRDVPLSPDGKEQAKKIAREVARDCPPDAVATSDLARAEDTARVIARECEVRLLPPSRSFRPWDVGKYAGEKTSEAIPVLDEYATETPDEPIPGGESFNSFRRRFFDGVVSLLEDHPDDLLLLVAHHRNERLLAAWVAAGCPGDGSIDEEVFHQRGDSTGSLTEFEIPVRKMDDAA